MREPTKFLFVSDNGGAAAMTTAGCMAESGTPVAGDGPSEGEDMAFFGEVIGCVPGSLGVSDIFVVESGSALALARETSRGMEYVSLTHRELTAMFDELKRRRHP